MQVEEFVSAVNSCNSVAIISHYNPDADAYGSSLGLAHSLTALGKQVSIYNETGVIERYLTIPGIDKIQNKLPKDLDLVIICDCGALNRVGDTQISAVKSAKKTINIDHHISNDSFGDINFVQSGSSSTCEIIYEILSKANFPINKESAICLMAGIVGDTGSFRYSSTSQRTFEIAAQLFSLGAKPDQIYKDLYASPKLGSVLLQAESIANLKTFFDGQYAQVTVTTEMIIKHQACLDDTDGLAEKARDIGGVKIAASIRQDGSIWRVSLRSVSEQYNVSEIASSFGGGGHTQAAAFRSTKPFEMVEKLLQEKVKNKLGINE